MGRILSIDYGQKRTGLAVTDELKMIATPLETVPSAQVISYLHNYFSLNEVECIVVGEAKQMNNKPSESAKFIEPFVRKLRKEFPLITIDRIDERFTSLMASRAISEAGMKRRYRESKKLIDCISAVIILQSYLEKLTYKL